MQKQRLRHHIVTASGAAVPGTRRESGRRRAESPPVDHANNSTPGAAATARHSLHPALAALPLAFLVGALGADVGAWWTDDPFWAWAALRLTGAGAALGALLMIPGLNDIVNAARASTHPIEWVDDLGEVAILALAVISFMIRLGDPVAAVLPWGLVLSAIITTLVLTTGRE